MFVHGTELYPNLIHWAELYPILKPCRTIAILIHWAGLYHILIKWAELYPILIPCRSITYLNTLSRTIPYLKTLSRTIPYLKTMSRAQCSRSKICWQPIGTEHEEPWYFVSQSKSSTKKTLQLRQPIKIEHYVTRELPARFEVPFRLSAWVGSLHLILIHRDLKDLNPPTCSTQSSTTNISISIETSKTTTWFTSLPSVIETAIACCFA